MWYFYYYWFKIILSLQPGKFSTKYPLLKHEGDNSSLLTFLLLSVAREYNLWFHSSVFVEIFFLTQDMIILGKFSMCTLKTMYFGNWGIQKIFKLFIFCYFVCMGHFACLCVLNECNALELELQTPVSCQMVAGHPTQVIWKSSCLSSPVIQSFMYVNYIV